MEHETPLKRLELDSNLPKSGSGVTEEEIFLTAKGLRLDISDAANPKWLSAIHSADISEDDSVGLAVVANHVYLTHSSSFTSETRPGLHVFDVSDPTSPELVGHNGSFDGRDIVVHGDHLLAATVDQGLVVLNPYHPAPTRPRVTCLAPHESERPRLSIHAVPGVNLRAQRSTDLKNWSDWFGFRTGEDPLELADPQGPLADRQFYRAVAD